MNIKLQSLTLFYIRVFQIIPKYVIKHNISIVHNIINLIFVPYNSSVILKEACFIFMDIYIYLLSL